MHDTQARDYERWLRDELALATEFAEEGETEETRKWAGVYADVYRLCLDSFTMHRRATIGDGTDNYLGARSVN